MLEEGGQIVPESRGRTAAIKSYTGRLLRLLYSFIFANPDDDRYYKRMVRQAAYSARLPSAARSSRTTEARASAAAGWSSSISDVVTEAPTTGWVGAPGDGLGPGADGSMLVVADVQLSDRAYLNIVAGIATLHRRPHSLLSAAVGWLCRRWRAWWNSSWRGVKTFHGTRGSTFPSTSCAARLFCTPGTLRVSVAADQRRQGCFNRS